MQKIVPQSAGVRADEGSQRAASFDRPLHAALARLTAGVSPAALGLAWADWVQHLLVSPDKQLELAGKAVQGWASLGAFCQRASLARDGDGGIERIPPDKRFAGSAWQRWPFNGTAEAFLVAQDWWETATTGVRGVSQHHEEVVSFVARQLTNMASPANFLLTNPEVLETTLRKGGLNLLRGAINLAEDWQRAASGKRPVGAEAFQVGRDVAVTPGQVIFRNRLIELIQYAAATETVVAEPILIVPAWIMKYYILDLSPTNSLVKFLVESGYTVFMVSWKNPGGEERDLGLDDYRRLGVMEAIDAVSAVVPGRPLHLVGYCLGGTLAVIVAAAMARDEDKRLKSLTLFAAQTDFTEAGELMLFIDEAQVSFLEDMMAEQGYLDTKQMAGVFQLLRSNDLIWSAMVESYLKGERARMIDLMAWNADPTRMPYRMHSEYLRRLFLNNALAAGHFEVEGRPVSLRDIHTPIFAVSTLKDHVAPWASVYKIQALTDADVTFVLSNGGHNAGIVCPPGTANRRHQIAMHKENEKYVDPEAWQRSAVHHERSWWPCWLEWLSKHGSGERVGPPPIGAPGSKYTALCPAPGTYVLAP